MESEEVQRAEKLIFISEGMRVLSNAQLSKLNKNMHKPGWRNITFEELFYLLEKEVSELGHELRILSGVNAEELQNVIDECADVANFAMFIADKAKKIMEDL